MKHELECLLHYLKWLQKCGNSEERIKQGLEYLYEFDLFGEETFELPIVEMASAMAEVKLVN